MSINKPRSRHLLALPALKISHKHSSILKIPTNMNRIDLDETEHNNIYRKPLYSIGTSISIYYP